MNLPPLPWHHRRQQFVKRLIDLVRAKTLRRSGAVQFVVNLIEDFAKLVRQRDPLYEQAIEIVIPNNNSGINSARKLSVPASIVRPTVTINSPSTVRKCRMLSMIRRS